MSDANHDFVSLGINLGKDRYTDPRLTISATDVAGLMGHLNDLTAPDEADPDQLSALDGMLDHVELIDKAVMVKKGFSNSSTPISPDGGFTPGGYDTAAPAGKTCAHGAMKYKEGTSKAGKPYKGYFCPAPMGQNQCKAEFVN
jgi:hypothetical protein